MNVFKNMWSMFSVFARWISGGKYSETLKKRGLAGKNPLGFTPKNKGSKTCRAGRAFCWRKHNKAEHRRRRRQARRTA